MTGVRWSEKDLAEFSQRRDGQQVVDRQRAAARKPVSRPEQELQIQTAEFLDWALMPPARWLHIPNGEKRDDHIAAILNAMGVKPGAADILVFTPGGRFIWIELKSETGRLSASQVDWRDWCRSIGAPWFLCRSLADVIEALTSCQVRLRGALT